MVERGLGLRFWAVGGLAGALAVGCGSTPANEIDPPDVDLVSVFYQVEGVVRGIGLPGTITANVDRVQVRAHPTNTETCERVEKDGSFQFSLVAVDNDILELTAALGNDCEIRGGPAFLRVPESPFGAADFVCCGSTGGTAMDGTCQIAQDADDMKECPTGPLTTACDLEQDCGGLEGEILEIDPQAIVVSPPDASGRVEITGAVKYKSSLVRVENLGLSPLGYKDPARRQATLTNDRGQFAFSGLLASADDELAIQVQDLNGFRSPRTGVRVPDPPLDGVDVVGVYPQDELGGNERQPLAIHIAPYGIDGRGLCPDLVVNGMPAPPEAWICYTGGVTHEMVTITSATINGMSSANLSVAMTSSQAPYNTGTFGDIRGRKKDIVVVVDMSAQAAPEEGDRQLQINAAQQFIDRVPGRDRIAVVVMTNYNTGKILTKDGETDSGLRTLDRRAPLKTALDEYASMTVENSMSGAMEGMAIAGGILRGQNARDGRIVILTRGAPDLGAEKGPMPIEDYATRYATAFDQIIASPLSGKASYPTHVVGLDLVRADTATDDKFSDMQSIIDFSQGRYWPSSRQQEELDLTLTEVLQALSGSFVLLYDADIPCGTGKSMVVDIALELTVAQGGPTKAANFQGPVRVQRPVTCQ